jgi:hypothetical protein
MSSSSSTNGSGVSEVLRCLDDIQTSLTTARETAAADDNQLLIRQLARLEVLVREIRRECPVVIGAGLPSDGNVDGR